MSAKLNESLRYLTAETGQNAVSEFGAPLYIYSEAILRQQAELALGFSAPYGLMVRYAMKANPLAGILRMFNEMGIGVDASSSYEVERALRAGIAADRIMLTSQELPQDLSATVNTGIKFNATSLHQLESYGKQFPGGEVSVRINSGMGSGHTKSVSVAGPTSSFGIWHEHIEDVIRIANRCNLEITTIHNHIGCGTDPDIWIAAAKKLLSIVDNFPAVTSVNLGGGFKVARTVGETPTDLGTVSQVISELIVSHAKITGRRLKVEIEPGTFLVANAGTLLARVEDIVDTGANGLHFVKLNTGMNDFLRPALHASQHPILPLIPRTRSDDYVVVGHNCESTDLLTPSPKNSETPLPRRMPVLTFGDIVAIEGVGAYCSSMNLGGYNSYPSPCEVLYKTDSTFELLKRSRTLDDLLAPEMDLQNKLELIET
jgi:diaminopimelate decarboxylase